MTSVFRKIGNYLCRQFSQKKIDDRLPLTSFQKKRLGWDSSTIFEFPFVYQLYSKITISKFLKGVLLTQKMQLLPLSLFRYRKMVHQIIIWVAISTTVLVTSSITTKLTRSKCEWTRIWTYFRVTSLEHLSLTEFSDE